MIQILQPPRKKFFIIELDKTKSVKLFFESFTFPWVSVWI